MNTIKKTKTVNQNPGGTMKKLTFITVTTIAFSICWNSMLFAADTYEPDDDFASAKQITVNQSQTRSIDPIGDNDYAYFDVATEGTYIIETSGPSGYFDTRIYLYDSFENYITYNDSSGYNYYSKITRTLTAGKYYVRVIEDGNNSIIPSYNLTVTLIAPDAYEPDNTYTTAQHLAVGTKAVQQHSFHEFYDEDWFHVSVSADTYLFFTYEPSGYLATSMSLYKLVGGTLDYITSRSSGYSNTLSRLVEPGEYYFLCKGYNSSSLGNYKFTFDSHVIEEVVPECKMFRFKENFAGKKEGHHNWKLGFKLPEAPFDTVEGISFVVRMINSNNMNTSTLYLPNGEMPEYNKKKTRMKAHTLFDFFTMKLSKKGINMVQVMKDSLLGNFNSPQYIFCMRDIETSPQADLYFTIEMWKDNFIYARGQCKAKVSVKYSKSSMNGKKMRVKKPKKAKKEKTK